MLMSATMVRKRLLNLRTVERVGIIFLCLCGRTVSCFFDFSSSSLVLFLMLVLVRGASERGMRINNGIKEIRKLYININFDVFLNVLQLKQGHLDGEC